MTRKMRFRFGAMVGSGLLAATTMLGAVALQSGGQSSDPREAGKSNSAEKDGAIVYAGGFGLFPASE